MSQDPNLMPVIAFIYQSCEICRYRFSKMSNLRYIFFSLSSCNRWIMDNDTKNCRIAYSVFWILLGEWLRWLTSSQNFFTAEKMVIYLDKAKLRVMQVDKITIVKTELHHLNFWHRTVGMYSLHFFSQHKREYRMSGLNTTTICTAAM